MCYPYGKIEGPTVQESDIQKPAPPSAPSALDEATLAHWQQWHQTALARMSDLAHALDRLDWMAVDHACLWVHDVLRPHHQVQERDLFPLLKPGLDGKLRTQLRADHRKMSHLSRAILQARAVGASPDDNLQGERSRRLLDLVRQHLDTEARFLPSQPPAVCQVAAVTSDGYSGLPAPAFGPSTPDYPRA